MPRKLKNWESPWNEAFGFTKHISNLVARARVRQNVLKRMSGCSWRAETNILRATHRALIESIISRGLPAVGSGAYELDLRRRDTCALNPAARKITGTSFPDRLIFTTLCYFAMRLFYAMSGSYLDCSIRDPDGL